MPASGSILIVDDDEPVRETLADLLESDGFTVLQAADAAQALMMLRENAATIGVMITDLSMPGADGIALIQQARKITADLPAILLTGYAEQAASVSMAAGGFHILRKPVQADDLTQQIIALLGKP